MLDAGNLIVIILLGWILICAGNPLLGVCEIFAVCHICGSHWGKRTHLNRQWTSHVTLHVYQVGLVVATCLWYVSNKFLMKPTMNAMKQDVEWGFCFDVHLNAFIPILVILHFIQLFVYHAIIGECLYC